MIKKIAKKVSKISGLLLVIALPFLAVTQVQAVGTGHVTCGTEIDFSGITSETATCAGEAGSEQEVTNIIQTIVDVLSIIVGIIAVFVIIIAGIRMITSNGDSGAVASSRSAIIYAIVGLVVVFLAQTIVRFVTAIVDTEG